MGRGNQPVFSKIEAVKFDVVIEDDFEEKICRSPGKELEVNGRLATWRKYRFHFDVRAIRNSDGLQIKSNSPKGDRVPEMDYGFD